MLQRSTAWIRSLWSLFDPIFVTRPCLSNSLALHTNNPTLDPPYDLTFECCGKPGTQSNVGIDWAWADC